MPYETNYSRLLKQERTLDKCPRCGKNSMVTDGVGAELCCSSCGLVLKDRIVETGPEWRTFSSDGKDDRSRTGTPTSIAMHDMGLATVIGVLNKDAFGRPEEGWLTLY